MQLLLLLASVGSLASATLSAPTQRPERAILDDPRFGAPVRERLYLREGYTQFNHGSFGVVPHDVMAELHRLQEQCEADPDIWIQSGYKMLLTEAREAMADYVGADPDNLVFVENASGGCNSFIRSVAAQFPAAQGSQADAVAQPKVLLLSCAYGMVKNVLAMLEEEQGVELVEVEVSLVLHSPELLLATVEEAILANGGAASFSLAVISHIASIPGVILPVEDFIELLPGVPVMIDGAHAPGAIPLELEALRRHHHAIHEHALPSERGGCAGCAGYIGNMHKYDGRSSSHAQKPSVAALPTSSGACWSGEQNFRSPSPVSDCSSPPGGCFRPKVQHFYGSHQSGRPRWCHQR